ncbi:MAG: helix-turn-helix domain-containing protein [Gammaproteobacteria bacterium]
MICILALHETTGAVLYGFYEVFSTFGGFWRDLMGLESNPAEFDTRIVAASRDSFTCAGGIPILPQASLAEIEQADAIIVTDLTLDPEVDHADRWPEVHAWLAEMYRRGSLLCSVCSGSVLLAGTGLLDGRRATTHWVYVDHFRRFHPGVRLEPARILVEADDEQRIVTTGGMASWEDLALYLIARFYGEATALNAARLYLFGDRSEGQLLFAAMGRPKRHDDAAVARSQAWIAEHYDTANPVQRMARESGLTERSFKRRFRQATGYTPIDYVQTLRVEEAKQLLESTSHPVDAIARQAGYEDPTSFRRVFKRLAGVTPGRYRQRFQDTGKRLRSPG